jgi:hypothetical protein
MRDLAPVPECLLATAGGILTALVILVEAAIAGGSWWNAWTVPLAMLAAAAAAGLATLFCHRAIAVLEAFSCPCARSRCAGLRGHLRNTQVATALVLGIEATACLAAATAGWVPVAAPALMWTITAALAMQGALIAPALAFVARLAACHD